MDFEWLQPSESIILLGENFTSISRLSTGIRPYSRLNTVAFDFNFGNEIALVNDRMGSRDPDVFL
jgi:hypothetical protein